MSTAIAPTRTNQVTVGPQAPIALIPQTKMEAIVRLDKILQESRTAIRQASPMARAFITAAAMSELEKSITKEMMADIKNLMDSPLGFKTDRREGATKKVKKNGEWVDERVEAYHETTVKRCVIVALLAGANLSGNEFNILVGQTYFTKEFMQRAVLSFPGINNFRLEIGNPTKHGDKTAAMDAKATWRIGMEEFSLECKKTDSGDMRIVVNAYETSGVDQLRGLAESKLLRRVFSTLTGIKSIDPDDTDPASDSHSSIEGKLASPIQIEHAPEEGNEIDAASVLEAESEQVQEPEEESEFGGFVYKFANADQVHFFIDSCCKKIEDTKTIDAAAKMAQQCLNDLQELDWSERAKNFAISKLNERQSTAFGRLRGMKS